MFIAVDERLEHDEMREVSMSFLGGMVVLNIARAHSASVKRIISAR